MNVMCCVERAFKLCFFFYVLSYVFYRTLQTHTLDLLPLVFAYTLENPSHNSVYLFSYYNFTPLGRLPSLSN